MIPYLKQDGNHADLQRVLEGYAPFVVRHSVSLRHAGQAPPTYDPVASSLRIQSSLDIGMSAASDGLRKTLVGARVIAHIRANTGRCDDGFETLYRSGDPSRSEVLDCVETLRESSTVTPPPTLDLMPEYWTKTEEAEAQLDLTRDQFCGSLRVRILERNPDLNESARERVTNAGSAFLEKLCRERGLGVAQNLATSSVDQASLRTVSLIQHLPDYFAACTTQDEAFAVVRLVADILTRPDGAEAVFLGLLCQAYFGQHLVGASETLAKVDLDFISGTCYVLDASVLVRLLAEGNKSHESAANLIGDLVTHGAVLTTTSLFLEETAEHARWAARLIDHHGEHSQQVIAALRSLEGYRANQFLLSYFLGSLPDTNFTEYLERMLGMDKSGRITSEVVADRLTSLGIQPLSFDGWEGFDQYRLAQRDEVQQEIDRRRHEQGTYRHDRQTQAEAEVAIIVDGIRGGKLQPPGQRHRTRFSSAVRGSLTNYRTSNAGSAFSPKVWRSGSGVPKLPHHGMPGSSSSSCFGNWHKGESSL